MHIITAVLKIVKSKLTALHSCLVIMWCNNSV